MDHSCSSLTHLERKTHTTLEVIYVCVILLASEFSLGTIQKFVKYKYIPNIRPHQTQSRYPSAGMSKPLNDWRVRNNVHHTIVGMLLTQLKL